MAEQVDPTGRIVSIDVDTRFQPPSAGVIEVRNLDVTHEPIGTDEYDVVHAAACCNIWRNAKRCSTR